MRSPFELLGAGVGWVSYAIRRRVDTRAIVQRGLDAVAVGSVLAAGLAVVGLLPEPVLGLVVEHARPLVIVLGIVTLLTVLIGRTTLNRDESPAERSTESVRSEQSARSVTEAEKHHGWRTPLRTTAPEAVSNTGGSRPHVPVTVAADEIDPLAHEMAARLSDDSMARERLWSVAVETVAEDNGVSDETASETGTSVFSRPLGPHGVSTDRASKLVESGAWTDNQRAAAYLSPTDEALPVGVRLRDWLAGESGSRRVRATVRAITERSRVDPPEATDYDSLGRQTGRRASVTDVAESDTAAVTAGSSADTDGSAAVDDTATADDSATASDSADDESTDELEDEPIRRTYPFRWEVEG